MSTTFASNTAALRVKIDQATSTDTLLEVIADPDCDDSLLAHIAEVVHSADDRRLPTSEEHALACAALSSPSFGPLAAQAWQKANFFFSRHAVNLVSKGVVLNEEALLVAVGDSWSRRDLEFRQSVLRSDYVTSNILAALANDWRVTLVREIAKHPLLTEETGSKFISHSDAKVRANVSRQPWVPEDSLYLLRDDPDASVSRAAKRAIKQRGLSETDALDAAIEDEVSAFFLAATDDEDTLVRLGSGAATPEETLRVVAGYGGRPALAVAANKHTPSALLEEMSLNEAANQHGWRSVLRPVLAGNPNNTIKGVIALVNAASWCSNTLAAAYVNHDLPVEVINERATVYTSKVRIGAIKSGKISQENVDNIMRYEQRSNVLTAMLEHAAHLLTDEQVRDCHSRGSERVKVRAAAVLEERNVPLERPEEVAS